MQSRIENRESRILEPDWEVLPPEEKRRREGLEPLFKWLALIMDEIVRVPGTKFRFGLDPLIGLIPGIGDTSSALVSAFALIQAARLGVPKILLARMSLGMHFPSGSSRTRAIIKSSKSTRLRRASAAGAIGCLSGQY